LDTIPEEFTVDILKSSGYFTNHKV